MANSAQTVTRRTRRSWTDEQLTVAIRAAHSWRGVARNLGLAGHSASQAVEREARRLGLDASHFGSPLQCTDAELATALASARSWPKVLAALGLRTHSKRCRDAVQARATKLGLSTDHLQAASRTARVPHHASRPLEPDLVYLRDAAESLVTAWLVLRGLWPAIPVEPRPYDLLLDAPTTLQRVQVKTSTCRTNSGSWQVGLNRHAGGGSKHDQRRPYAAGEVDLFAILDGDLRLYLVPRLAVAGRVGIYLRRYEIFVVGSAASIALPRPMPGTGAQPLYRPTEVRPTPRPDASHSRLQAADYPGPAAVVSGGEKPGVVPVEDVLPGCVPASLPAGRPVRPPGSRWAEDELRDAAERATSWADMLRTFGFKPSSTKPRRALQREVQHFGIDTTHFVGQRTWSDKELIEAAPAARTWAELCGMLGLSTSARHYESVRAAADRLGLRLERMTLGPKAGREAMGIEIPDAPNLDRLSVAAPSIATAWFRFCGLVVSASSEPAVYDLVVHMPEGLRRVQVKSTTLREHSGSWLVRVGHRPDGLPTAADFIAYDAEDVDLFFVVDGDLLLYLIPADAIPGRAALSLRAYTEFIVGDASSLLESRNPASPTVPRPRVA